MAQHFTQALAGLALCVMAGQGAASDIEAGRDLARQCSACHGKDGIARDPEVPNLAGQSSYYLEKSLKDYQTGAREDRRMTIIAQGLSDADIKALSAYYEAFTVTSTPPD